MSTPPPGKPVLPHRTYDLMAGVLSYLIPGLGQMYQGRVGKGVLFLVCIYTMFFYGLHLGSGTVQAGQRNFVVSSNVYLPDMANRATGVSALLSNLYNRPQYIGQFWVGIAAWPALFQYATFDTKANEELERDIDRLYQDADQAAEEKNLESAQHYREQAEELERQPKHRHPILGQFQREPSSTAVNAVHNAGDKRVELAWVYTVIAGVLNIMVIYDAIAGPAFLLPTASVLKRDS
jgi:hypothetical protein